MGKKRLNIIMDEELHTRLKVATAERGITMSQYIVELIKKELDEHQEQKRGA